MTNLGISQRRQEPSQMNPIRPQSWVCETMYIPVRLQAPTQNRDSNVSRDLAASAARMLSLLLPSWTHIYQLMVARACASQTRRTQANGIDGYLHDALPNVAEECPLPLLLTCSRRIHLYSAQQAKQHPSWVVRLRLTELELSDMTTHSARWLGKPTK